MKFVMIGIYLILSASGLIFFKLGSENNILCSFTKGILNFKIGYLSILGIICYGCSFVLYLGLVSKYNLSYIVPVTTGIMYIIILVASSVLFKEVITGTHIIGAILVLSGVTLLNLK